MVNEIQNPTSDFSLAYIKLANIAVKDYKGTETLIDEIKNQTVDPKKVATLLTEQVVNKCDTDAAAQIECVKCLAPIIMGLATNTAADFSSCGCYEGGLMQCVQDEFDSEASKLGVSDTTLLIGLVIVIALLIFSSYKLL